MTPDQIATKSDSRYGQTKIGKIRAAYNDLRKAIRSGDLDAAEAALDRYEPWADYVFDDRHEGSLNHAD